MSTDSYRQTLRRQNLALLLADPIVGGPAALARLMGKPKMKAHLSNIISGARGMGDKLCRAIEHAATRPEGWMDQQHPVAGEPVARWSLAHQVSDPGAFHTLQLLSMEYLVNARPVPDVFRFVLADDALAPDLPKGTEVVWTTRRRPEPGRLILLRDTHGQVHARRCHQGRAPGHWSARATNPVYVDFESDAPGITLLAIYKGQLEPDDI